MKSLIFAGVATSILGFASTADAASDSILPEGKSIFAEQLDLVAEGSRGSIGRGTIGRGMRGMRGMRGHRGPRVNRGGHRGVRGNRGRFFRGNRGFRGGFIGVYQRPFYGFSLPSYWLAPGFYVNNYSTFGLTQPQPGYYWSRYYDDAVLRNQGGVVRDYRQNVDWSRGGNAYAPNGYYNQPQPEFEPSIQADRETYQWGEGDFRAPAPEGTTQKGVYNGQWTGRYVDEEKRTYRGQWDGTYTDENGRVYQGTYRGTSVGDPVYRQGAGPTASADAPVQPVPAQVAPPAAPVATTPVPRPAPAAVQPQPQPVYQTPSGYERYERCLKRRGLTGGTIGAVIGAVAGNRIAGRGNRLAGSLIGGGLGALAGVGIEKATNKCRKYLPRQQVVQRPTYPQQQPYGYGWNGGYYYVPGGYYYPQQQVTVTVTPGTTTTTTVTEEVVEYVEHRPVGKRMIKPKAKRLRKPSCRC